MFCPPCCPTVTRWCVGGTRPLINSPSIYWHMSLNRKPRLPLMAVSWLSCRRTWWTLESPKSKFILYLLVSFVSFWFHWECYVFWNWKRKPLLFDNFDSLIKDRLDKLHVYNSLHLMQVRQGCIDCSVKEPSFTTILFHEIPVIIWFTTIIRGNWACVYSC